MPARRSVVAGLLAAAALVGAGIALLAARDAATRTPPGPREAAVAALGPGVASRVGAPARLPELPPLPRSLRGTDVAGALPVDARGHLRVVPAVLELFDWFLAASGEEPLAVILARLDAEIGARLGPPADREARALLERYLAYREAARALAESVGGAVPLERRFQLVRELRRARFGAADAEALFGAEEARIQIDLERRRVALDDALTERERAERLASLDAELPDAVRETREAVLVAARLREEERALREQGAGVAEIEALRERRVGPAAARRLAALDHDREAFASRLADNRGERDAHHERTLDDDAAPDEAHAAQRAEHIAAPERVRIEALDRLEGVGAAAAP
jgi:lipase chaperone LimK